MICCKAEVPRYLWKYLPYRRIRNNALTCQVNIFPVFIFPQECPPAKQPPWCLAWHELPSVLLLSIANIHASLVCTPAAGLFVSGAISLHTPQNNYFIKTKINFHTLYPVKHGICLTFLIAGNVKCHFLSHFSSVSCDFLSRLKSRCTFCFRGRWWNGKHKTHTDFFHFSMGGTWMNTLVSSIQVMLY